MTCSNTTYNLLDGLATPLPPPDCELQVPSTCTVYAHGGIPDNPLPPRDPSPCPLDEDCSPIVVDSISTSTSSASLPAATACTTPTGPYPIGYTYFESGAHAGQCISFECQQYPNNCGCPGAPPPAAGKEKRVILSEPIGSGGPGPVCLEPVCESCPFLTECINDAKRSPQENCHHVACDGGLTARSGESGICSCFELDSGIV